MSRTPLPIVASALLLALAVAGCKRDAEVPVADTADPAAPPAIDAPADERPAGEAPEPALSLRVPTTDGGHFDLSEQRGQWVLVNIWTTDCEPCLAQMPELSALDAMREHISVLGIVRQEVREGQLRDFLQQQPLVFPIAAVPPQTELPGFDAGDALPTTFLIQPDGILGRRYDGPVTATRIEKDIAELGGPDPGA